MPSLDNITWERLVREDAVTYPCDAPDKPGNEIIFRHSFPTKSGRAKIVPADLLPPDELPDERVPDGADHGPPAGALAHRLHDAACLQPRCSGAGGDRRHEPARDGPAGHRARRFIRVSTRRGAVVLKARADRDVAEGMVFIPFCFAEAAANLLTNPQLDPMGKIPEFKFCACKVEQADMAEAAE